MNRALEMLALGVASAVLAAAVISSGGNAQTGAPKEVYASSIGGVVSAPRLSGKVGQGYLVYAKWCAGCHATEFAQPGTDTLPEPSRLSLGTNVLGQRYKGSVKAALEERNDLTPDAVASFVRNGINAMPAFRKTEISDTELQALGAYLSRNTRTSRSRK